MTELAVTLERGSGRPLRAQLEDYLRTAVRGGVLPAGTQLPASRVLAQALGLSRGVVVEAYAQLVAEGYLEARAGAGTRVAAAVQAQPGAAWTDVESQDWRYDFRPGIPDLSLFPRSAWLAAVRDTLRTVSDRVLGYGEPAGAAPLRAALAAYLGRVRGVVVDPQAVTVVSGFAQGLGLLCQVLHRQGLTQMAVEDPTHPEQRTIISRAGLQPVPISVDVEGVRVDELTRSPARAVLVTPAHQFPSGAVLSARRRTALIAWARERAAVIVEDDYDAEYRYDRTPVGALQGLAPDQVVYVGSVSKMLAPALRIGWLVPPRHLAGTLAEAKRYADLGSPTLDQLVLAHFLERGALDRHLRRARSVYRARRDTLERLLTEGTPAMRVLGVAAGLHAVVELPLGVDERSAVQAATERGIRVYGLSGYFSSEGAYSPALVLGYAALSEHKLAAGIAELRAIIA